jgi:diaminohydroxyphosphoribosylaminopyrimidine deaminase / 5-amino-6-(5-phosphoribosylamino)uracil reductase
MLNEEVLMQRAIFLAHMGRGQAEPNPMVGCVIVKNDRIIGQGFYKKFGGSHAEPNALASCIESPSGAAAYVTLEPCCYTAKKTPPCVPKLIEAKIARVVIGCLDPNPPVNGNGVRQLRDAHIQVDTGLLETSCKQLIAPFIARTNHSRPYYTAKWAQTADGKIAGPGGKRQQISNAASMRLVHQLRSRCDAIIVGVNTVLTDDPQLTSRAGTGPRTPLRFVLDRHLRTPENSRLVQTAREVPVIIGHGPDIPLDKKSRLESLGVKFCSTPNLGHLHPALLAFNATHAVVEPGPILAKAMFDQNLPDRLWVITSPNRINDPTAPTAATIPKTFTETARRNIDGDTLVEYLNTKSPVFFAVEPSADFILASEK